MDILASNPCAIPVGAHLTTPRRGFTHHGIHIGNGRVVHYPGSSRCFDTGPVCEVSIDEFERGHGFSIAATASRFNTEQIVVRARSRIGEAAYSVTANNCEHFCHWCLNGTPKSEQVETFTQPLERFLAWVGTAMPARLRPAPVVAV